MLRVGVIFGGISSEREASLASGRQVYFNVDRSRYQGVALFMDRQGRLWHIPDKLIIQNTCTDICARLEREARRVPYEALKELIDVAFIALHGKYGDDGCIQGVLELLGIPYTGSGVLACALSMDKPMAHKLLTAHGLEVARELVVTEDEWRADPQAATARIVETTGLPCVVKPTREGSSIGVTVVETEDQLPSAMETAFQWDTAALVEEKLVGMEFSCIVLGNDDDLQVLLPTETVTRNPYMTYDDKYMPGRSQKITPARVPPETIRHIQDVVARTYKALGFTGYGRMDGFLLKDGRVLLTDPNSTSGMSPSSFMFHQAAEAGMTPMMLITRIIELGLEAHRKKRGPL